MKKGTTFERKGRTYEILQDGAEYIGDWGQPSRIKKADVDGSE